MVLGVAHLVPSKPWLHSVLQGSLSLGYAENNVSRQGVHGQGAGHGSLGPISARVATWEVPGLRF